jgi:hypothetical protein
MRMNTVNTKKEAFIDEDFDSEEDDWYSIEEIAKKSDFNEYRDVNKRGRAWKIPSERKEKAEEIIEEDRYYLENLED